MKLGFRFKSLQSGLLLTDLFLIAFSLSLLAWRVKSSLDASRLSETKREQAGRAILVASAAGDWLASFRNQKIDIASLAEEASTLSHELDQLIALFDYRGHVLADSADPGENGRDMFNLSEVFAAMQGRSISVVRCDEDDSL